MDQTFITASLIEHDGAALWLQRTADGKRLALLTPIGHAWLDRFSGEAQAFDQDQVLKLCPLDTANAQVLQEVVPNLKPVPLGLSTSAGCGDRMGLATPGHVLRVQRGGPSTGRTAACADLHAAIDPRDDAHRPHARPT